MTTDAKLIRRNASKKLASFFASVKTAELHCRSTNYSGVPFKNLESLQESYNNSQKARLYETGEGEYYLSINSEEWYICSTNEPKTATEPLPAAPKLALVTEIEQSPEVEFVAAPEFRPDGTEIELSPEVEFENAPEQIEAPTIESLQAEIAKLKQQLAQTTAPAAPATPKKAPIQLITLRRAEGPHSECGEVTATDWAQADKILKQWARTAPATGGTHKCDLMLEFSDGESFKMGLEIQRSDIFTLNLAKHVLNEISFRAGENPGSLTPEQYQKWLSQPWAKPATYKQLLSQWLIPA